LIAPGSIAQAIDGIGWACAWIDRVSRQVGCLPSSAYIHYPFGVLFGMRRGDNIDVIAPAAYSASTIT